MEQPLRKLQATREVGFPDWPSSGQVLYLYKCQGDRALGHGEAGALVESGRLNVIGGDAAKFGLLRS